MQGTAKSFPPSRALGGPRFPCKMKPPPRTKPKPQVLPGFSASHTSWKMPNTND